MRIISFVYGEHCCGLTVFENGKVVYCYEEERFSRVKTSSDFKNLHWRYPILSLNELHHKNNIDINSFDVYLFPDIPLVEHIEPFFNCVLSQCNFYIDKQNMMQKMKYYDHHDAHCGLAYYTSGFVDKKCLVVSIDALGSGYSAKYYLGENNRMTYIDGIEHNRVSFGLYYAMLTEFLGFQRLKDEGKIVGMSSHGKKDDFFFDCFESAIGELDGIKTNQYKDCYDGSMFREFYHKFFGSMGSGFFRNTKIANNIAYAGQTVFENKLCELFNNLHNLYPEYDHVCVSGGVFANVKVNKKINDLPWVKEMYVTPPMGDEGLPLGACLKYSSENGVQPVHRFDNVYLGSSYNEQNVSLSLSDVRFKGKVGSEVFDYKKVANLLNEGHIVGLFQGRMEHGPRALGNRTILADPRSEGTYKKLNDRLHRNDFMPFAPVVLDEYVDLVFNVNKSRYTAEFMTMLYDTRPLWYNRIPAALHPIDKTARIQILHERTNKRLYDIMKYFYDITNTPVLINTSFNVHEEPIVCYPENALMHLVNGVVDYLVIEDELFYKL